MYKSYKGVAQNTYTPYESINQNAYNSNVNNSNKPKKKASFWEKLGDTALDIVGGIGAGIGGFVEGVFDSGVSVLGGIGGLFGADTTWGKI